jgi:hypothetical protein
MGIAYNPGVVSSGLVLALDAGNNKSHSSNRFISYGSGLVTEGVGFAVNGDGTFQRVAAGTVIGGYTVKTTDVVYSYALGSNGCHYHGNDVSIPAGVYATFTFDYLVTGATTYPITDYLANFEQVFSNAIGTANNLQNVWQRRSFTSGPSGNAASLRMLLYPGYCGGRMADSGTLYMRNPRVEWTNVDTGTENFSSRPNTNIWYDMSGNGNNGTLTNTPYHFIGVDGTNGYMSFDGSNDFVLLSSNTTFGNNTTWEAWIYSTGNVSTYNMFMGRYLPYFGFYAGNGLVFSNLIGGNQVTIYASGLSLNTWYHTTFTTSYDGTNTTMRIYVNGVETSSAVYGGTQGNYSNPFMIGDGNNSSNSTWYPFVGRISNVKIYNRTLTVNEIQQNFQALRGRFGI